MTILCFCSWQLCSP